jgi:hypothetical protein
MKKTIGQQMADLYKGGSGSGNFGHSGRTGERGGSSDEGGGSGKEQKFEYQYTISHGNGDYHDVKGNINAVDEKDARAKLKERDERAGDIQIYKPDVDETIVNGKLTAENILGTKKVDYYDNASPKEMKVLEQNLKIVMDAPKAIDNANDDGESQFLTSMYSRIQTFGATDYSDHRGDTVEQLTAKILPSVLGKGGGGGYQRLNYYQADGSMVDTLKVKGYLGGYTGQFEYKGGRINPNDFK